MTGLTYKFLPDPLLRQPFICTERKNSDNELIAAVTVNYSELDVRPLCILVLDEVEESSVSPS